MCTYPLSLLKLFFFRRFFFSLKRKSGKRKSVPYFPEMVMPSKAM
jgi:hypothetical protein